MTTSIPDQIQSVITNGNHVVKKLTSMTATMQGERGTLSDDKVEKIQTRYDRYTNTDIPILMNEICRLKCASKDNNDIVNLSVLNNQIKNAYNIFQETIGGERMRFASDTSSQGNVTLTKLDSTKNTGNSVSNTSDTSSGVEELIDTSTSLNNANITPHQNPDNNSKGGFFKNVIHSLTPANWTQNFFGQTADSSGKSSFEDLNAIDDTTQPTTNVTDNAATMPSTFSFGTTILPLPATTNNATRTTTPPNGFNWGPHTTTSKVKLGRKTTNVVDTTQKNQNTNSFATGPLFPSMAGEDVTNNATMPNTPSPRTQPTVTTTTTTTTQTSNVTSYAGTDYNSHSSSSSSSSEEIEKGLPPRKEEGLNGLNFVNEERLGDIVDYRKQDEINQFRQSQFLGKTPHASTSSGDDTSSGFEYEVVLSENESEDVALDKSGEGSSATIISNPLFNTQPAFKVVKHTFLVQGSNPKKLYAYGDGPGMKNFTIPTELENKGNGVWAFNIPNNTPDFDYLISRSAYQTNANSQDWEQGRRNYRTSAEPNVNTNISFLS